MPKDEIYLRRNLNVTENQDVTALDCIGWEDPVGGMGFRAFFKSGTDIEAFPKVNRKGHAQVSEIRAINGGLMVIGTYRQAADSLPLALADGRIDLLVQAPETELFADMNVCIAERNGEPFAVIADWLRWHVTQFGLQAVLLLDREKPNKEKGLEKKLKALASELGLRRFVHLKAACALGSDDLPAASHPFNAPDAPGKDRMEITPDPQYAPLVDLSIYELARWRYLARARAVMNLDLSDLLCPGADPFGAVHDSSQGVISLIGQRIYPWRVRPKDDASFGDHICRQFEPARPNRRWCLAPSRLKPDQIWRYVRITNAEPQAGEQAQFWRAMAIRHPHASAAEIVPKTSLIEDEVLLRLARKSFGHKPVRPPESKMKEKPAQAVKGGRTCIVTCMKNEGPFILEWIAYHRAIGVDDFLIYTNDCTDGTDEMLDLLQAKGMVQRRDNKFAGSKLKPQHWALKAAEKEDVLRQSGWAVSMDVDEFINIHVGRGHLDDLYKAVGEANMISMTWRLFGNADVHGFEDAFLIDQFDRCAPELARKPHQAWGFKTLFRNIGIYKKMGVHRPKGLKPDLWDQITWVNGSGKPMPRKLLRNGWRSTTDSYGYDLVTLNHYAVRSAESFLVKRDRGRVNHVARDQGLSYWFRMNNNWQEDRSIQTKRDLLAAEFERLMADPEIAAAHSFCVTQHKAKIAELKSRDDYAAFYADLTSPRMERLARMHTHFGANVFLAGPEVVPDEVVEAEIADDFFFTIERKKTTH